MVIDIHERSKDLLQQIADSMYERSNELHMPPRFGLSEVSIVEQFLLNYTHDVKRVLGEY